MWDIKIIVREQKWPKSMELDILSIALSLSKRVERNPYNTSGEKWAL